MAEVAVNIRRHLSLITRCRHHLRRFEEGSKARRAIGEVRLDGRKSTHHWR